MFVLEIAGHAGCVAADFSTAGLAAGCHAAVAAGGAWAQGAVEGEYGLGWEELVAGAVGAAGGYLSYRARAVASTVDEGAEVVEELAEFSGILRSAAAGKGNYGIGSATAAQADDLGRAWVGPGYRTSSSDPNIWISRDGLRQYRRPSYKPYQGGYQANFEWRPTDSGSWLGNGHLDITDLR